MKYPTITDYIEAVSNIQGRLMSLTNINPIFDHNGEVVYSSGKSYVNFKVHTGSVVKTLRCFTSIEKAISDKQSIDDKVISGEFLDDELYVFMGHDSGDYFPVMLLDDQEDSKSYSLKKHCNKNAVEGLCAIKIDDKWGYCNTMGEVMIETQYTTVSDFSEGRAIVSIGEFFGMIDRYGNQVIPIQYDDMSWNDGTLAYVDLNGKHGCMNRMGEEVVPLHYDWVGEFNMGLSLVELNSKFGYVNLNGQAVIPIIYDSATSFSEQGTAKVTLDNRTFRINRQGEELVDGAAKR